MRMFVAVLQLQLMCRQLHSRVVRLSVQCNNNQSVYLVGVSGVGSAVDVRMGERLRVAVAQWQGALGG